MTNDPDINLFRPDRRGIRKVLGDLEAEIMEIIWAHPLDKGITVRDVFEILYERRRIAYTTVMSTMSRLAKKKLLRTEKDEQAYRYYANFTQNEFITRFVGQILENLLVGFTDVTMDKLKSLSDAQTPAQVQHLLEEISRRRSEEEGE